MFSRRCRPPDKARPRRRSNHGRSPNEHANRRTVAALHRVRHDAGAERGAFSRADSQSADRRRRSEPRPRPDVHRSARDDSGKDARQPHERRNDRFAKHALESADGVRRSFARRFRQSVRACRIDAAGRRSASFRAQPRRRNALHPACVAGRVRVARSSAVFTAPSAARSSSTVSISQPFDSAATANSLESFCRKPFSSTAPSARTSSSAAPSHRRTAHGGQPHRPCRRVRRALSRAIRYRRRRTRSQALRRPTPAYLHRPRHPCRPRILILDEATSSASTPSPRRSSRAVSTPHAGPHHLRHRPPPLHDPPRRSDPRRRAGQHRRTRHP